MKKLASLILCIFLLVSLVACAENPTDTISCPSCGNQISYDVKFCPDCGAAIDNEGNDSTDDDDNPTVCSHDWANATCTAPKTCKTCQATEGGPLGHDWANATCTAPKTCKTCQATTGSALGHTTTTGVCSRCNERIGWTRSEVQGIIQIRSIYVDEIDSAGGVDMEIQWKNTAQKTIKYIYFSVKPYNAVGDVVYCSIRDYALFNGYCTGPFDSGYTSYWYHDGSFYGGSLWENCWYNNTVKTIELVGIRIIYMDDSEIELDKQAAALAFASDSELENGSSTDSDDSSSDNDAVVNGDEITVYNATDFLNYIGSDKKIIIGSEEINLSDATNVNNSYVKKSDYNDGYVISDVENLTIEGETEILIDDMYANVLEFQNCCNITLNGLTVGHSPAVDTTCAGDVIYLYNCENFNIENCNLFGCGVIGIHAEETENIQVTNSNIYDCSYSALYLTYSTAKMTGGSIYDIDVSDGYGAIYDLTYSCLEADNVEIKDNACGNLVSGSASDDTQNATFVECTIKNNTFEEYIESLGSFEAVYDDCEFVQNNITGKTVDISNCAMYADIMPISLFTTQEGEIKISSFKCEFFDAGNGKVNVCVSISGEKIDNIESAFTIKGILYSFDDLSQNIGAFNQTTPVLSSGDTFTAQQTFTNLDSEMYGFEFENHLEDGQGLRYSITEDNNGYVVLAGTSFDFSTTTLSLPSSFNGKNVVAIKDMGFWMAALETVTIPDTVTILKEGCFWDCDALEAICIPNSVTKIEAYSFYMCSSLKAIHFNGTIAQWNAIQKDEGWDADSGEYTVYCSDGNISK